MKSFKYFLYVAGSVLVFLFLVKGAYYPNEGTNKASAFEWEKQVNIYLLDSKRIEAGGDCREVFPVSRTVLNAETLGPGALEVLLLGPIPDEMGTGFTTAIPNGVLIQKFEIKNKVAYVDFSKDLNDGVAGSCMVGAIRSQIENTLNSLSDIDSVVISVNEETEGILEP